MNAKERYYDVEIVKRVTEVLKSSLMSDAVKVRNVDQVDSEMMDVLSDIILTSYLLGKQMGISYNILNLRLENKIKSFLAEEQVDRSFELDLKELAIHISS